MAREPVPTLQGTGDQRNQYSWTPRKVWLQYWSVARLLYCGVGIVSNWSSSTPLQRIDAQESLTVLKLASNV